MLVHTHMKGCRPRHRQGKVLLAEDAQEAAQCNTDARSAGSWASTDQHSRGCSWFIKAIIAKCQQRSTELHAHLP
jgi:hypothetical protein